MVIVLTAILAFFLNYLTPREDHTVFRRTSTRSDFHERQKEPIASSSVANLFSWGLKAREVARKKAIEEKQRRTVIRYRAPQIIGENDGEPHVIRAGAKLIGFLANPIDTRAQSLVRVLLPHGGESAGIEIEKNSVLIGRFSYSGDGDHVLISFSRLDSPDGKVKKVNAVALDAASFTAGIAGEEFTGSGTKLAASLGLTMFSGMADTLTDREALGNSFNGVQARPTMKNALLQGLSKASQDQASRTAGQIEQSRNYVIVPEGKEMIIELQEDFGK